MSLIHPAFFLSLCLPPLLSPTPLVPDPPTPLSPRCPPSPLSKSGGQASGCCPLL
jgi:hypothetical protein